LAKLYISNKDEFYSYCSYRGFILFFWHSYYAKYIEKVLGVNAREKTPAFTKYDGVDFIPAKNWLILFGHHFSSIAGAAPGPISMELMMNW